MSPAQVFDPSLRPDERDCLLRTIASCLSTEPVIRGDGGVVSNYVPGHLILGDAKALRLASSFFFDAIRGTPAGVVAGEVSAACALVSAVVSLSAQTTRPLAGRYVRKRGRRYGLPGLVSAPLPPASNVFLVDDVAATGACGVRCIESLRSLGHNVVAMMVLVDRNQGASERLSAFGVDLWTLFTLDEVRAERARSCQTAANG